MIFKSLKSFKISFFVLITIFEAGICNPKEKNHQGTYHNIYKEFEVNKLLAKNPSDKEAYPFEEDPIGRAFYGKIKPIARTVLEAWEKKRDYSSKDFPLSPEQHDKFRKNLRDFLFTNIQTTNFDWDNKKNISNYYKTDLIEKIKINGNTLKLYRLTVKQTNDEIPIALCLPKKSYRSLNSKTPGVVLFSGHTANSGLFDLIIDKEGYQKAMAIRLCDSGFISLAVEKLDSGYTSIRFQEMAKINIEEREPGGGGDDELEVATTILNTGGLPIFGRQLIANISALDFLLSFPNIDKNNIGAAGVSFGGWQAVHMMLMRDDIKSISNFGGMWSYLETHMENINLAKFEGVSDFSQSFPDIFRFGDQNRFVLAVAGSKMQIAYGEMDIPYVEHKKYYFPLVRKQYDALDKNEMLEEVIHKGGHEFSPNEVISFFKETLK